jgi:GMP synthase PP-ATPase subunit
LVRPGSRRNRESYGDSLRAVTSTNGMTADFYPFDMKFLGETATCIINEGEGCERGGVRRDQQAARDD